MKIKATVTYEYKLEDSQIAKFRDRVLRYLNEELDEDREFTLDDISIESVEEFLSDSLPGVLEEALRGYSCNCGIEIDEYFGTISFDYCGEDVNDLVKEMADIVIAG